MMRKIWLFGVVLATTTFSACFYYGPCLSGSGPVTSEQREVGEFTGVTNTGSFDIYVSRADNFSVEVRAQENLIAIIETYVSGSTLIVEAEGNSCFRSGSPVEVHVTMPETDALTLSGSGRVYADEVSSTEVEISNSGSGSMEINTLMAESLGLNNSGSGYIEVSTGDVSYVDAVQSGSGTIMCGILFGTSEVDIRHSSSGRVSAELIDGVALDAVLSGSGRIELSGNLEVAEYSLNSSGRIDALELEAAGVDATSTGSGDIFVWANDILNATITGSGDIIYKGKPSINISITGSGNLRSY